jgi:hypothetical protein
MDQFEGTGRPEDWLRWAMDHLEGQVNFGDTKAGLLLTADSILFAGLLAVGTSEKVHFDELRSGTVALMGLSFAALVSALLLALLTILPSRRNLWRPDVSHRGLTNFSAIASLDAHAFLERLSKESFASLEQDAAWSVHGKATWATRKFKLLYAAIALTQVTVALGASAVAYETV